MAESIYMCSQGDPYSFGLKAEILKIKGKLLSLHWLSCSRSLTWGLSGCLLLKWGHWMGDTGTLKNGMEGVGRPSWSCSFEHLLSNVFFFFCQWSVLPPSEGTEKMVVPPDIAVMQVLIVLMIPPPTHSASILNPCPSRSLKRYKVWPMTNMLHSKRMSCIF
jgi:hypothetical protein